MAVSDATRSKVSQHYQQQLQTAPQREAFKTKLGKAAQGDALALRTLQQETGVRDAAQLTEVARLAQRGQFDDLLVTEDRQRALEIVGQAPQHTADPRAAQSPAPAHKGALGLLLSKPKVESRSAPSDLDRAPPSQKLRIWTGDAEVDTTGVPMDIRRSTVDYVFDVPNQTIRARAELEFEQEQRGAPVLDFGPRASGLTVDGAEIDPDRLGVYGFSSAEGVWNEGDRPLDGATPRRVLEHELEPGAHKLTVEYQLNQESLRESDRDHTIEQRDGGIDFFMHMHDYENNARANFLDGYAPSNLEFDHHPTTMRLRFEGATREHKVISNGAVRRLEGEQEAYEVEYPAWYNSSSHFMHVVDPSRTMMIEDTYRSKDGREIPITIYSDIEDYTFGGGLPEDPGELAALKKRVAEDHVEALEIVKGTIAEMEEKVGPIAHDKYVARINPYVASMEHAGATHSRIGALRHEVIHSWFGRGVLPASGDAGWLDEALTSWSEHGMQQNDEYRYQTRSYPMKFNPVGPNQRHTDTNNIYVGKDMVQDLDLLLRSEGGRSGGMRDLLPGFFDKFKHKSITIDMFRDHVKQEAGPRLADRVDEIFEAYGDFYERAELDPSGCCAGCAAKQSEEK